MIVGTSTIKPLLPIAVPFESKFGGSLGKALSAVDFDRDVILKNIFMATDKIGILSYNIRENSNSYAVVSPDRMDDPVHSAPPADGRADNRGLHL